MASLIDENSLDFESEIPQLNQEIRTEIGEVVDSLLLDRYFPPAVCLYPRTILNCNAASQQCGVPFSKAWCDIEVLGYDDEKAFHFGEIYSGTVRILVDFLALNKPPSGKLEKYLLSKLLRFIIKDRENMIFKDIGTVSETKLATLLANHLFGRLSTAGDFIMDKNCQGKSQDTCHCGKKDCKLTGSYGDTSIGNPEVWHGFVDIIINNDIPVSQMEEEESDSPGGRSPVEVKLRSSELPGNNQIIAETIVFSFLQKKRHPNNKHFLTPCIGVSRSEMIIWLYDAEHDVLLESSSVPLMEPESLIDQVSRFSLEAVLMSWLVVNYKHLCGGLTEAMKSSRKADFFNKANKKIDIYKNDLKFRDVGGSTCSSAPITKKRRAGVPSNDLIDLHITMNDRLFKKPCYQAPVQETDD